MKLLLPLLTFFAFTATMAAQENRDVTQRQPPVVTQEQVEHDAKLAREERQRADEERKVLLERQKNEQRRQVTDIERKSPATTKKTSTGTKEQ